MSSPNLLNGFYLVRQNIDRELAVVEVFKGHIHGTVEGLDCWSDFSEWRPLDLQALTKEIPIVLP